MNQRCNKIDIELVGHSMVVQKEMGTVTVANSLSPASVNVSLPHTWDHIRQIRNKVAEVLKDADSSVRIAAVMVTSELVENAVKYGEPVPAARQISVSLAIDPGEIVIRVTNGSADTNSVAALERRVTEIMSAPDKSVPYMARLEELMEQPTESGRLGLYRIAFEGEFDMRLSYVNQVVTMTATRSF